MKRAKVLTADAAGRELAKVLRVAATKEDQLRDLVKERKGEIAALHKRARELMDIANGAPVQVELDTSDEGEDEPTAAPAVVAEVLKPARSAKRERQRAQEAAHADRAALDAAAAEPIVWRTESDGRVLGVARDGVVYAVVRRDSPGGGQFRWTQGHKARGNWRPTQDQAQSDADAHERERHAQRELTP